jgi:aerobic carbon-monoxide dehydrogenase medium subunit
MKPASFEYHDPTTLDEALSLLAQFGDEARPLAGGQSLVPLMNFRLLRPAHLVDLNSVSELTFLTTINGELRIGATTRQRALEKSSDIAGRWPLLRDATRFIGHIQIRNRGTVGGSLAHAFPSAELPVAMVTLDAALVLRSTIRQRTVLAGDFFQAYMATALEPGELLTEIVVPALAPNTGWSFQEVSRRHGDFALAGAAALITLDGRGKIDQVHLTLTGAIPICASEVEKQMRGELPSDALFTAAAQHATKDLEQDSDIHASAEYRRSTCAAMAARALAQAAQRAAELAKESRR